jgi:hypothetical protein
MKRSRSYRFGLLGLVSLCQGCGGVMDYMSRPIEIHGSLTRSGVANQGTVLLATPGFGHGIDDCAKILVLGQIEGCRALRLTADEDGSFKAEFPASMRGCPFFVIPPLLNAFCDYKSYLLISVAGEEPEVRLVVINKGRARVSRVEVGASKPARQSVRVTSIEEVANAPQSIPAKRDVVTLAISSDAP